MVLWIVLSAVALMVVLFVVERREAYRQEQREKARALWRTIEGVVEQERRDRTQP
jgi:hypothetical protein